MKKYTLIALILAGTTFVSYGQTKKELRKQARIEAKAEKAAKKIERKLNKLAAKGELIEAPVAEEIVVEEVFVGDPANPIAFDQVELYRKDIKRGTDDLFNFKFRNTGTKTIAINEVKTSCGCTKANVPTDSIAPGEYSEIAVKYDTKRIGNFKKTITVKTNVSEPIFLVISGNVLDTKLEEVQPKVELH